MKLANRGNWVSDPKICELGGISVIAKEHSACINNYELLFSIGARNCELHVFDSLELSHDQILADVLRVRNVVIE